MGKKYKTIVVVDEISGSCPLFKKGDRMVFDSEVGVCGNTVNLKESDAVCMTALTSWTYREVMLKGDETAVRAETEDGTNWFSCPAPGEPLSKHGGVLFRVMRV